MAFHNLGCKVNAYETDVMIQNLKEKDWKIVPFDAKADVYVINTCTVTNIADRKSRQMLHRAKKENPDAVVIAVGCYVETGKERVAKDEAIDLAIGTNKKGHIAEIVETYLKEKGLWNEPDSDGTDRTDPGFPSDGTDRTDPGLPSDGMDRTDSGFPSGTPTGPDSAGSTAAPGQEAAGSTAEAPLTDAPEDLLAAKTLRGRTLDDIEHEPAYESMLLRTPGRTRADIKIQDGCNQFCTYCIIPYARGRVRSRRQEEVLEEVRGLAAEGVKEIIVTGIHIGSYGLDFEHKSYNELNGGNPALLSLLLSIAKIEGIERIRLGSLEPRVMNEEFVAAIAAEPRICPHFHLSLQSGSNSVLKRMNRRYTAEEFMETVERLRRYYDRPALTTDVIVGFPGETEEEFRECVDFLEKVRFYEIHVFKYSRRHGTAADRMPDQITEAVKEQRSRVLQEMTVRQAAQYRESFLGEEETILAEEVHSYAEMNRRTQMAYDPQSRGRIDAKSCAQAEQDGERRADSRWLIGHTSRYVQAAVPIGTENIPSGTAITGRLEDFLPGTTCLQMNRFA